MRRAGEGPAGSRPEMLEPEELGNRRHEEPANWRESSFRIRDIPRGFFNNHPCNDAQNLCKLNNAEGIY